MAKTTTKTTTTATEAVNFTKLAALEARAKAAAAEFEAAKAAAKEALLPTLVEAALEKGEFESLSFRSPEGGTGLLVPSNAFTPDKRDIEELIKAGQARLEVKHFFTVSADMVKKYWAELAHFIENCPAITAEDKETFINREERQTLVVEIDPAKFGGDAEALRSALEKARMKIDLRSLKGN